MRNKCERKDAVVNFLNRDSISNLDIIEQAAGVCYDKSTKRSKEAQRKFLSGLIEKGHLSPFEHGRVAIQIPKAVFRNALVVTNQVIFNHRHWISYVNILEETDASVVLGFNYRSIIEYLSGRYYKETTIDEIFLLAIERTKRVGLSTVVDRIFTAAMVYSELIEWLYVPTDYTHLLSYKKVHDFQPLTFKITTDRGISHELVRHRTFAITQLSTRYVSHEKQGVLYQVPSTINSHYYKKLLRKFAKLSHKFYKKLMPLTPQIARCVLPTMTSTTLYMTGYKHEWEHFVYLRASVSAHPDIRKIANIINMYI